MLNKKQAQKDLHENGNKHEVRKKIVLIKKLPHKNTSKDRTANGTVALTACKMWRRWEPTGLGYLQDTGLVTRVLTRQVAFRGDRHILSSRITSHHSHGRNIRCILPAITTFLLAADRPGTMCLGESLSLPSHCLP